MQYDTFAKIMSICNSIMTYKFSLLGYQVNLYEALFYELIIVVVLGGALYLFKNN